MATASDVAPSYMGSSRIASGVVVVLEYGMRSYIRLLEGELFSEP